MTKVSKAATKAAEKAETPKATVKEEVKINVVDKIDLTQQKKKQQKQPHKRVIFRELHGLLNPKDARDLKSTLMPEWHQPNEISRTAVRSFIEALRSYDWINKPKIERGKGRIQFAYVASVIAHSELGGWQMVKGLIDAFMPPKAERENHISYTAIIAFCNAITGNSKPIIADTDAGKKLEDIKNKMQTSNSNTPKFVMPEYTQVVLTTAKFNKLSINPELTPKDMIEEKGGSWMYVGSYKGEDYFIPHVTEVSA